MFNRFITSSSKTKFAPAERADEESILRQNKKISESKFLDSVLTKIPFVFLIVNNERQIIYSNELLIKSLGYKNMNEALGLRPGELFSCTNAHSEETGCGTSENCRYCGAVQAMLESKKTNDLAVKETRISILVNNEEVPQDFEVSSKPFIWDDETFYIVTLNDISSKKRKEQLERVFFHDLINKAGSLSGLIDIINERGQTEESSPLLGLVARGMKELLKDIAFQKQIQQAEAGELKINPVEINSLSTLTNIKEDFISTLERDSKYLEIDKDVEDFNFMCDEVLLNRILTNLIKNALEASVTGETVIIGAKTTKNTLIFSVSNPTVMTDEVKSQVFQRSFSTKGAGRGLGTYSIKMFTDSYLGGKANFTSEKRKGTIFTIELPFKKE